MLWVLDGEPVDVDMNSCHKGCLKKNKKNYESMDAVQTSDNPPTTSSMDTKSLDSQVEMRK